MTYCLNSERMAPTKIKKQKRRVKSHLTLKRRKRVVLPKTKKVNISTTHMPEALTTNEPKALVLVERIHNEMVDKEEIVQGKENSIENNISTLEINQLSTKPSESSNSGNKSKILVRKDLMKTSASMNSAKKVDTKSNVKKASKTSDSLSNDSSKTETPKSSSKRRHTIDSEKLGVPLIQYGWWREIVYRNNLNESNFADVYYHSPPPLSRKFRSKIQVADELLKKENRIRFPSLTDDHFSFSRISLGLGPPYEIERHAMKAKNSKQPRSSSSSTTKSHVKSRDSTSTSKQSSSEPHKTPTKSSDMSQQSTADFVIEASPTDLYKHVQFVSSTY